MSGHEGRRKDQLHYRRDERGNEACSRFEEIACEQHDVVVSGCAALANREHHNSGYEHCEFSNRKSTKYFIFDSSYASIVSQI